MTARADEGLFELHWGPKEFCNQPLISAEGIRLP